MAESMAQWVERQAISKGRIEEAHTLLVRWGSKRFGAPNAQTLALLEAISELEDVERLGDRLVEVESWQELFE